MAPEASEAQLAAVAHDRVAHFRFRTCGVEAQNLVKEALEGRGGGAAGAGDPVTAEELEV